MVIGDQIDYYLKELEWLPFHKLFLNFIELVEKSTINLIASFVRSP